MSVFESAADAAEGLAEAYATSPFAASSLYARDDPAPGETAVDEAIASPFAEAFAALDESQLETEAFEALAAELEDEEFSEALSALADEAAARHLTSTATWAQESEAPFLATAEVEQWMESIAGEADRLLGELEAHFGERSVEAVSEAEIDAVAGFTESTGVVTGGPVDAQERFIHKLVGKVRRVVRGVGRLVGKGVRALGKLLPVGKLFGLLRRLVRPLLQRVLRRAIGKLPPALRPLAARLTPQFAREAEAETETEDAENEFAALADEFDARLAEVILTPNEAAASDRFAQFEAEMGVQDETGPGGPVHELDVARQRLARELREAEPGRPPLAEMEQFIPVVMAAMPLLRLGVRIVGRGKIVNFLAKLLAQLIQGMVGPQAAQVLSRHLASAGLGLLGLEAEAGADGSLGAEGLVAATEDTIREVLSLPAESLDNELLLEAAVQEAFAEAAVRHFPPEVLRPELTEAEAEHGVWMMMPRATRPCYRYKKYSRVLPVTITRAVAREMTLAEGETLEERLLDAGARDWPLQGEVHLYELLPGGELGHLAAFELDGEAESYADGALEFEELVRARPLPIAAPGARGRGRRPGARFYRLRVRGLPLRRRRRFSLRVDLSGVKPELRVHLHVSERSAHLMVGHLERRRYAQVVTTVRGLVGPAVRQALATRLERMLGKRGIPLASGAGARLAATVSEGMVRAVAKQLPAAAATLATAAKDPAVGATLTFAFAFDNREAVGRGEPGEPTLTIRSGLRRD